MNDITARTPGACREPTGAQSAGIVQRLDDLMRRCREDGHPLVYQDLLAVRCDGLSGAVTACGGHRTGQPAAGAPAGAAGPDSACGALGPRASDGALPASREEALRALSEADRILEQANYLPASAMRMRLAVVRAHLVLGTTEKVGT